MSVRKYIVADMQHSSTVKISNASDLGGKHACLPTFEGRQPLIKRRNILLCDILICVADLVCVGVTEVKVGDGSGQRF